MYEMKNFSFVGGAAQKKKLSNIFSYLNLVNKRVDTDFQTALRFHFGRGNIFFFPHEGRTEPKWKLSPVQLFSTQLRMRMVLNGSRRCSKPLEPIQQTVSSAFCDSQVSGCLERWSKCLSLEGGWWVLLQKSVVVQNMFLVKSHIGSLLFWIILNIWKKNSPCFIKNKWNMVMGFVHTKCMLAAHLTKEFTTTANLVLLRNWYNLYNLD